MRTSRVDDSRLHLTGWICLLILSFLQAPGRTAADTKFDLTADPFGFLAAATHAYTDEFTLGQIQNQAYGYLFPHGLFFLLTEPLPDWVAQRLWWTIVLSVGFSGALLLARRMGLAQAPALIAAVLYALSPRIMTTLTAISSEAWPVVLVPWTLIPLTAKHLTWRHAALAVVPIALMGAVNATATMVACLPAFILLLWRTAWRELAVWLAGTAAVSAWWIGPLLVLGRYSPPFTDFIESSFVTTRWLNLAEILRGTTSWAPFVDTERVAGHLLVTEPVFVLATLAVAALGIIGLSMRGMPWRGYWVVLLCLGVLLMGAAHGPFGDSWTGVLDRQLSAFRNLHKLDPLVRLPIVLGVGYAVAHAAKRTPALVAAGLVTVLATAPAWTLRLAPEGTWKEVSPDWVAAAEFINENASGTRTLVVPQASFARQTWGWTRDEPIQALTDTRFAVRDAIPLVDPEAIRGLDGQIAALHPEALRAIGVGAVVVRHDLEEGQGAPVPELDASLFGEKRSFGEVDVWIADKQRDMMITPDTVTVAGGGEVLPLLDREFGYSPRTIVTGTHADIVTDTPALAKRNYGTLDGPTTAHLTWHDEGGRVGNPEPDYPSAARRVEVAETGGMIRASSSADDADAFGGADPSRSLTSAVDGLGDTAWFPAPGDREPWIEVTPENPPATLTITTTKDTTITWKGAEQSGEVDVEAGEPTEVDVQGARWLILEFSTPTGVSELSFGVDRIVEVDGLGDTYFFQRLLPATDVLLRAFTTDRAGTWELSAPATIDGVAHEPGPVQLPAGRHELVSDAKTVALSREVASAPFMPFDGTVTPAGTDQLILTTRAFNEGLRGAVDGVALEPVRIDAGMQAFRVPAGTSGEFSMTFAGSEFFRWSLFGGVLSALALLGCAVTGRRASLGSTAVIADPARLVTAASFLTAIGVAGMHGLIGWFIGWAVRRFTLIPAWALGGGAVAVLGLWLARAPWPAENYAGDSGAVMVAGCVALACVTSASQELRRARRTDTPPPSTPQQ